MELASDLLKEFAAVTNDGRKSRGEQTAYGTAVINDGTLYVKLDGADSLTPAATTMDVQDGDRVMLMIKNHMATIIGNITSPAVTRLGEIYMRLTADGLEVGRFDANDNPVGMHVLIAPGVYYIVDANGNRVAAFSADAVNLGNGMAVFAKDLITLGNGLASFSPSLVKLGNRNESEIQLCNGKGSVKMDGDALLLRGTKAVGLRNSYGTRRAEAVCRADSTNPKAALQTYNGNNVVAAVVASNDGVAVTVPSGKAFTVNGIEMLRVNAVMTAGTVKGTGKIGAGKAKSIEAKVQVPTGYSLAGIREIKTNHNNICRMTQFYTHPSTNTVGATFVNTSSKEQSLTVSIEWFAIRCSGTTYTGETNVTWSDDGN